MSPFDAAEADFADPPLQSIPNMDLNKDELTRGELVFDPGELPTPDVGRALSLALRLRKRNKGTSHTQAPKNVAISAKPGASVTGPRCLE